MGNYIDTPMNELPHDLTVVRNADVLSGQYICRYGFCVDSDKNLIGRVSAAMGQANPAVMQ